MMEFGALIVKMTQAIARVFARHGEKKTRSRARMKFLIKQWGIDKFKEAVLEERKKLTDDPRWTEYLRAAEEETETPLKPPRRVKWNG